MFAPQPLAARSALVVEDIGETSLWLSQVLRDAFGDIDIAHAVDLRTARAWFANHAVARGGLIVLLDLGLPDGSGVELIHELRERGADVQIIVTTVYDDDKHLLQAMAAGADGYLLKDRDAAELVDQLRGLDRGEAPIAPVIARRILEQFRTHARFMTAADDEDVCLTPRETDVLRLIGWGLTLNEAATVLGLSRQTIPTHVKKIYRKLGIASRAEAALEAARRNLT